MPNVNLNNCRIEFHFYGDACPDAFDEAKIADALAEAADALVKASEEIEETRETEEAANAENSETSEPQNDDASEKAPPKVSVARITELVRRAAAGATEKRDGV